MCESLKIIISFVLGFVVAQLIKFVAGVLKKDKIDKEMSNFSSAVGYLTRSGGMPSGHTASFVAATVTIGLYNGFDSAIFALALCTTGIVVYDAMNVRRAVGEQGKVLNKLAHRSDRVVEGHSPIEVFVGMLLGILIGFLVFTFF